MVARAKAVTPPTTDELVPDGFLALTDLVGAMPTIVKGIEQCRTTVEALGFSRDAAEHVAARFGDSLWTEVDRICADRHKPLTA